MAFDLAQLFAGLKPLSVEDGENGYWDAKRMGNGQGQSYIVRNGVQTYISDADMERLRSSDPSNVATQNPASAPVQKFSAPLETGLPSTDQNGKSAMGFDLAQLFGSPGFKTFAGDALADLGYGLTKGTNLNEGFQLATQRTGELAPYRAAQAEKRDQIEQEKAAVNKTVQYLRSQPGGAQFADAIESGGVDGSAAFKAWFDASRAPADAAQNPYMNAGDGKFFNWQTGEYTTDPNAQQEMPAAPSGYQWNQSGALDFIPGGPADPKMKVDNKPPTEAQQRAASLTHVVEPELKVIEDNWEQLKDGGNQSAASVDINGWKPLQGYTSPGFQQAQNSLKTIISSYLYAISGATANPGEVQNNIDILTPKFGESQQSQNAKKDRVRQMVEAIKMQAKGGLATEAGGGDGEIEGILSGLGI